ncbi:MAG: hypothetical protein Q8R86_00195 [Sulfuricurvum sp.]|nr:hypothetical protein [Sulfuricurvum sp.]
MDKVTLLLIMVGLLFTLIFLVLLYVWVSRTKRAPDAQAAETFESLQSLISDVSTSNNDLVRAVEVLIEKFIQIGEGTRDYSHYEALIERLCIHPHTDSKVVLRFERALRSANPRFKEKIEKALKHGLAHRG